MLKRLSNLNADKVRKICIGPTACFSILIRILFHEHLCSDGIYYWYTISSHRSSSHESYLSACAWSLVQERALKIEPDKDQSNKANLWLLDKTLYSPETHLQVWYSSNFWKPYKTDFQSTFSGVFLSLGWHIIFIWTSTWNCVIINVVLISILQWL